MNPNIKKFKYPQCRPVTNEVTIHEAKTENLDTHTLSAELNFINDYLNHGNARGRSHSKAVVLDGRPGYLFVTSMDIGKGIKRDCITFSSIVNDDILLTDLDSDLIFPA